VNVPACTFTSSGTVTSSTSGGGTVATPHVSLTGPSGSLMNVTTGTGTGGGILQPGVYALNTSDGPNGNADSSNATFSANGDSSGSVSVAC
jgi:hypothetical protein